MRSRKGQGLSYLGGCILAEQTWHGVLGGLAIPQTSPPTWEAKATLFFPLPPAGCLGANATAGGQEEPLPALSWMPQSQNNPYLPWLALLHCPEDMVRSFNSPAKVQQDRAPSASPGGDRVQSSHGLSVPALPVLIGGGVLALHGWNIGGLLQKMPRNLCRHEWEGGPEERVPTCPIRWNLKKFCGEQGCTLLVGT